MMLSINLALTGIDGWFLPRVNSVIGIGVGAGAYVLSRFAVSDHHNPSISLSHVFIFRSFKKTTIPENNVLLNIVFFTA